MVQEKEQKHSLGEIVRDAVIFIVIVGAIGYAALGYGIRRYDDARGGTTRSFANVSGYSGTVKTWQPFSGWRKDYFNLFSRKTQGSEITIDGPLEAIIGDGNANGVLDKSDYVQTKVNGKPYRFYGDGRVTDTDNKDIEDKAVTGKSIEILATWGAFLSNFR